jgi:hypothetical protein
VIKPNSKLTIARVPLSQMEVHEHQRRYPDRVLHYVDLMISHPDEDAGIIHLKPLRYAVQRYEILDGHHRYCASILAGRSDALSLIIDEPEEEEPLMGRSFSTTYGAVNPHDRRVHLSASSSKHVEIGPDMLLRLSLIKAVDDSHG